MGIMYLAAPATASKTNPTFFLVLIVIVGLFYIVMIRPQRNRQRKAQQTQSQVVPGQRIRTTAGMYGTIVSGDERDIVVELAPGVEVKMLRRAVMDVLPDESLTDPSEHDYQQDFTPDDQFAHENGHEDASPAEDEHEHEDVKDTPQDDQDLKGRS